MSIADKIQMLQGDSAAIAAAIAAKGVTVPSGSGYDDYASLIGQISGGGGITPTGTIPISSNGTYDVTQYASANVNVEGGGSSDYVQPGLIFHLDGSNATTSQWVDKAQGITFNMDNVVLANGGVVFNGSSSKGTSSVPLYNASYLCGTIEVVISTNSPSTTQFVFDPGNTFSMAYGLLSGRALCFMSGPNSQIKQNSAIIGSGVFVQTVVKSSLNYVNGSSSSFGTADAWGKNNSYITIGCRNNNSSYFNGTIYQIRVYARELTVSEILHNQAIDMLKYNIQ